MTICNMRFKYSKESFIALFFIVFVASPSAASQLTVRVQDNTQQVLSNVVIELIPRSPTIVDTDNQKTSRSDAKSPKIMKQLDQQFVPHILTVQKGTEVAFPDTDTVQHHVYSFSPAKVFEIAIYKESLKRQILFDQAGVVELGCNIHDWMLGYIYIANSTMFAQTDKNGEVNFKVPAGHYDIKVWHPRIQQSDIDKPRSVHHQGKANNGDTLHKVVLSADILPSYTEYDDVHGLSEY